jgi:hypothetical protein
VVDIIYIYIYNDNTHATRYTRNPIIIVFSIDYNGIIYSIVKLLAITCIHSEMAVVVDFVFHCQTQGGRVEFFERDEAQYCLGRGINECTYAL